MLAPPAHDLARAVLGRRRGRPAASWSGRRRRPAGRRALTRGTAARAARPARARLGSPWQIDEIDARERPRCRCRGRRRSSAPRRRPSRARPPPTRSPVNAAAADPPGQHRQRDRCAGHDVECRRTSIRSAMSPSDTAMPAKPVVGDEQVRAATDDEDGQARLRCRRDDRRRSSIGRGAAEECRRRRRRGTWSRRRAATSRDGERRASTCRAPARWTSITLIAPRPSTPAARERPRACISSGSSAMSPQPIEMHTSPGRSSASQVVDELGATGHPHDVLAGGRRAPR